MGAAVWPWGQRRTETGTQHCCRPLARALP